HRVRARLGRDPRRQQADPRSRDQGARGVPRHSHRDRRPHRRPGHARAQPAAVQGSRRGGQEIPGRWRHRRVAARDPWRRRVRADRLERRRGRPRQEPPDRVQDPQDQARRAVATSRTTVSAYWWGEFDFKPYSRRWWRLGSLTRWGTRMTNEWQVGHRWSADPFDETIELREGVELPRDVEPRRYLFSSGGRTLRLLPRVADRPFVTRPEMPVIIPANEQATLYMASPLWVELAAGDPLKVFAAISVWRASSTWFGEDTIEGTMWYASRTRAG